MTQRESLQTSETFEQFIALPENQDRRFELIDGEIVEKGMPTQEHGVIAGNAITHINIHLMQNNIEGVASVEARHRPPGDNLNDRLPDVSYVAGSDKPLTRRGTADFMPDLVIEVQSPDDSLRKMLDHAEFYLANGVRMVWLIYPAKRWVEVLTPDDRRILEADEFIDGGDVLPGFRLPVSALFRGV